MIPEKNHAATIRPLVGMGVRGAAARAAQINACCGCEIIASWQSKLESAYYRWVQSIKHEVLDHFIVIGEDYFNHLISEYVEHYLTNGRTRESTTNSSSSVKRRNSPTSRPTARSSVTSGWVGCSSTTTARRLDRLSSTCNTVTVGTVVRHCLQQRTDHFHLAILTARANPVRFENGTPSDTIQQD
jgi:hypothetical protein